MISYQEMIDLWGENGLLHLPAERFGEHLGVDASRLPPYGAMPAEVPILFTAYLAGEVALFDVLELQIGDDEPMGLIVLGATPDDEKMLYAMDGDTGAVLLVDLGTPSVEKVNSSFADFVEFLYHLERFIRADEGKAGGRAILAARLRTQLSSIDPAAFEDPESWWSVAFAQLEGRI